MGKHVFVYSALNVVAKWPLSHELSSFSPIIPPVFKTLVLVGSPLGLPVTGVGPGVEVGCGEGVGTPGIGLGFGVPSEVG